MKVPALQALLCLNLSKLSGAAITGIAFRPSEDVVTVDEEFAATPVFTLTGSQGITRDPVTGTFYALVGSTAGSQELVEICASGSFPVLDIKPSNVLLECLTSGPQGWYSIDSITKTFGRIKTSGHFKKVATLNSPYETMVLAQNDSGEFHYINGEGRFYKNPGTESSMTRDPSVNFPTTTKGMCGDYYDGRLIAAPSDRAGGIATYDFSSPTTVEVETVTPKFRFSDVTGGDLNSCYDIVGVRNKVYGINSDDMTREVLYNLKNILGVTNDPKTGTSFAIVGAKQGKQTLVELTSSASIPIADIPSSVLLSCLTSGPSGMFAIDDISGTLGKVSKSKGTFKEVASLPGPYDTKVLAQDSSGLLHFIDGKGRLYTNPGKSPSMTRKSDVNFPTSSNGVCGDFDDGGDILSAINEPSGGYNVYLFSSPTTVIQNTLAPRTRLNDVSSGTLPS